MTKECKEILKALWEEKYPNEVPDIDQDNINLLMVAGLVKAQWCKGENRPMLVCPRLTSEGRAYLTENPKLKNPTRLDWKFYITIAVAIVGVIIAYLEYKN